MNDATWYEQRINLLEEDGLPEMDEVIDAQPVEPRVRLPQAPRVVSRSAWTLLEVGLVGGMYAGVYGYFSAGHSPLELPFLLAMPLMAGVIFLAVAVMATAWRR